MKEHKPSEDSREELIPLECFLQFRFLPFFSPHIIVDHFCDVVTAKSSAITFDHPKRIKIKHEEEAPDHESQRSEANLSDGFNQNVSLCNSSRYLET
jgi:hypothetical protein